MLVLSLLIGFLQPQAIVEQHLMVCGALRVTGVAPPGEQRGRVVQKLIDSTPVALQSCYL